MLEKVGFEVLQLLPSYIETKNNQEYITFAKNAKKVQQYLKSLKAQK